VSTVGRVAALAAVIAAIALVAMILFGGLSNSYTVTARFVDAGQVVKGSPVQTGGTAIGSVQDIGVTQDGQAAIKLKIDDKYAPLPEETTAQIKQLSLSGIANRYVDLQFGPGGKGTIADGGTLTTDRTRSAVELDALFDTLDARTRKSLQNLLKGQARQFKDRGDQANAAIKYLNPGLSTSRRLFEELTRDTPLLERFLTSSSKLVTDLAERRQDLAGLVGNLNDTTRALGDQKAALAESVGRLPPFLRRANTTFVNLRATLDDLDPLVTAAKPVARKLGPFLTETRALAAGARPTVRDLSVAIRRPGGDNDLVDLIDSVPPLEDIALATERRSLAPGGRRVSVGETRGAFPEGAAAFRGAAPVIATARPYTPDFLGWLDDFSTTGGGFDALGAYARAHVSIAQVLFGPVRKGQFKRCPGGAEARASDGSNLLSAADQTQLDCREAHRAVGP
jgi:phospholipid/cholesterol/gamma-HCH transport system substrate-binding protein